MDGSWASLPPEQRFMEPWQEGRRFVRSRAAQVPQAMAIWNRKTHEGLVSPGPFANGDAPGLARLVLVVVAEEKQSGHGFWHALLPLESQPGQASSEAPVD